MAADLRKLLDDLDAAREKATPGEWVHNPVNGVHTPIGACIATSHRHDDEKRRADAALIVAAVNNLPRLTAAVRAVLGIVDEWGVEADARYGTNRIAKGTAARVLRDALAAALDPAPPDQAES